MTPLVVAGIVAVALLTWAVAHWLVQPWASALAAWSAAALLLAGAAAYAWSGPRPARSAAL